MASAAMAYGERRFGATYAARIFLVLGVVGLVVGLWSAQADPRTSAHPNLLWVSIGLLLTVPVLWIVLGKSVLIINVSPRCNLTFVFCTIGGISRPRIIPIASFALRKFDVTFSFLRSWPTSSSVSCAPPDLLDMASTAPNNPKCAYTLIGTTR